MDFITHLYRSKVKLYRDRPDVLVPGRWFWCPEDAKDIPYFHRFLSYTGDTWDREGEIPEVGELHHWYGRNLKTPNPRYTGQHFCGTQEDWEQGPLYSQRGTRAVDEEGVPLCCDVGPIRPGGALAEGSATVVYAWVVGGGELAGGGLVTTAGLVGGGELAGGGLVTTAGLVGGGELAGGGVLSVDLVGGGELAGGGVLSVDLVGGGELAGGGLVTTADLVGGGELAGGGVFGVDLVGGGSAEGGGVFSVVLVGGGSAEGGGAMGNEPGGGELAGGGVFGVVLVGGGSAEGGGAMGNESGGGELAGGGLVEEEDVPTGAILAYGAASAPTGYLLCDGSAVSRSTYSALFALIGTAYGIGDGSTTFNVPDFMGRAIVGAGSGSGLSPRAIGAKGGEEDHTLITAELASHSHGVTDPGHTHSLPVRPTGVTTLPSFPALVNNLESPVNVSSATTGISINNAGNDSPHNNMQPFGVAAWIIKT